MFVTLTPALLTVQFTWHSASTMEICPNTLFLTDTTLIDRIQNVYTEGIFIDLRTHRLRSDSNQPHKSSTNNGLEIIAICDVLPEKWKSCWISRHCLAEDASIAQYTDYIQMLDEEALAIKIMSFQSLRRW